MHIIIILLIIIILILCPAILTIAGIAVSAILSILLKAAPFIGVWLLAMVVLAMLLKSNDKMPKGKYAVKKVDYVMAYTILIGTTIFCVILNISGAYFFSYLILFSVILWVGTHYYNKYVDRLPFSEKRKTPAFVKTIIYSGWSIYFFCLFWEFAPLILDVMWNIHSLREPSSILTVILVMFPVCIFFCSVDAIKESYHDFRRLDFKTKVIILLLVVIPMISAMYLQCLFYGERYGKKIFW